MKNTLLTIGVAGFASLLLSSFVLSGNDDNVQKPKKSRHVKMVKIVDGKKAEIDTVFTTDDVFVWKGDTINPMKHREEFMIHRFGKGDGGPDIMMFKHRRGEKDALSSFDMDPEDDMDFFADENDSIGKEIIVRKMGKGRPVDHIIFMNGHGPDHVPPMPPAPPVPHIMRFKQSGRIIDLNDPNVISYKKKDLSGGREKIEIIRKKVDLKEESFDFKFEGDDLMAPMPPDAPEVTDFDLSTRDDSLKMKVIERGKIIKGKNGKEFEVKIESQKK